MKKRKVRWDEEASVSFKEAITYIRKQSPQNADKVKKEILEKIKALAERPEIYPTDKYKENNAGQYKAFEIHRYRIGYLIEQDEVIIARIRHTPQDAPQPDINNPGEKPEFLISPSGENEPG